MSLNRYSIDPQLTGEALAKATEQAPISATLLTWCAVHGSLQLALRHPGVTPSIRGMVEPFVEQLGTMLVERGFFTAETLRESIELEQRYSSTPP
jgi:hypothetical protein